MFGSSRKSLISVIALMLILVFTLSACGGSASNSGSVLRVGVDDVYPPMEYKDDTGTTVGFDIDLATEIGKRMGMKVEFVSTAWDGIFTALEAEKFDCIISSLSVTEERKKTIAYTRPYIANAQVIVVNAANDTVKTEKDLKGKVVGVQVGTTAQEACEKYMQENPFKDFKKYEQIIQTFADLKVGRVDAIVADEVVARHYVVKDPKTFKVAVGKLTNEPIGIGFKLKNSAMRDKADKALEEIIKDGTLKKISEKWFGEDLTKNIQ